MRPIGMKIVAATSTDEIKKAHESSFAFVRLFVFSVDSATALRH
jgi:hypothetical protein